MAWNDQPYAGQSGPMQQGPVQQQGDSVVPTGYGSVSSMPAAVAGPAPLVNPLHAQAALGVASNTGPNGPGGPGGVLPTVPQQTGGPAGQGQTAQASMATEQAAQGYQRAMSTPTNTMDDDGQVPADDLTWINHTRRAIAETHGDPHRQVQLLQHIRAQYLKQRFGRSVRTDEK